MEPRSVEYISRACGGKLLRGLPERSVRRVCTDSRQAEPGDLFVALIGEKHDGHEFLKDVLPRVAAVVVQKGREVGEAGDCGVIAVEDTRKALGQLAGQYRLEFSLPVVAVSGSNGKTTTKELVAAVLRQKFNTLWSEASFNNDVGVPLTLLRLEPAHQAAVLEAGTNHPGELAPLVRLIQPRYGILTAFGREHLEFFGDLAGVAREEGWLAELLPREGVLLLNGDSEWSGQVVQRTRASVRRLGFQQGNEWRVASLKTDSQGVTFRVESPQAEFNGEYRVNLLGQHQAANALFAVALGAELGLSREEIGRGLASCAPPKMRLQLWEVGGVRVLDDSYNANADSVLAALRTLRDLPCRGRRVAVLGDMAELGAQSEAAHAEVGRWTVEHGVEQLFVVGKMASLVAQAARQAGLNRVLEFGDVDSAAAALKSFIKSGDLVLLKASRVMRLERIGESLRDRNGGKKN